MTKVVYVTGCLGFIGSYVTKTFLDLGWYVRGIDKCTYAANEDLLLEFYSAYKGKFVFERKDINELSFLYDCDYVINTAAETHVGNSIADSSEFITSNIDGVYNLLELIRNHRHESNKKPTLIHFSTDEVYGDIKEGFHKESDILKPSNPYSATKAAADMLILAWARTYNLPYIIVRPTNNYGIGQYVEKLIPKTCKSLTLNRKIPLHDHGTPVRNWLHAQDTANAIVKIIESDVENEIFNISGGFEQSNFVTVKKVLEQYYPNFKDDDTTNFVDFSFSRKGQDVRYAIDDKKIRSLGWKPKMDFDSELPSVVNHYKNKFIW